MLSISNYIKLGNKDTGQIFFLLGTFFLASALPISFLFYLISLGISFKENKKNYFKDKYNISLLLISVFMVIKNIKLSYDLPYVENFYTSGLNLQIWLDLFNWIPYFLLFFFSQKYLQTTKQRSLFSKALIAGSIPVIISCLLQSWFNIYGPFETLFGLIVWFQKPIIILNEGTATSGISGLFSNQNYAGLWLVALIPFIISLTKNSKNYLLKRAILLLSIYCILLTSSKNALIGLFVIVILYFGIKSKQFLISSGILLSVLTFISFIRNYLINFYNNYRSFFQINLIDKLLYFDIKNSSRIEIYKITSQFIYEKPIFGWGKSLFPYLYTSKGGYWDIDHSHSMILEMAFNYGIPLTISLIAFIGILLYKSWSKISLFKNNKKDLILNKCWILSGLVVVTSQISDITYYDGKIATLTWILLAGLRCIGSNKNLIIDNS